MKGYDIAIFIIMTIFGINIIAASGVMGNDFHLSFYSFAESISAKMVSVQPSSSETISYTELAISSFGMIVQSLVIILAVIAYSSFLLPSLLSELGLPTVINAMITLIVYISYVITYAQFKSRMNIE